jgi:hypothetical protein
MADGQFTPEMWRKALREAVLKKARHWLVTSAVQRGANLIKITDITRHKCSTKTYSRCAEAFVGHGRPGLLGMTLIGTC